MLGSCAHQRFRWRGASGEEFPLALLDPVHKGLCLGLILEKRLQLEGHLLFAFAPSYHDHDVLCEHLCILMLAAQRAKPVQDSCLEGALIVLRNHRPASGLLCCCCNCKCCCCNCWCRGCRSRWRPGSQWHRRRFCSECRMRNPAQRQTSRCHCQSGSSRPLHRSRQGARCQGRGGRRGSGGGAGGSRERQLGCRTRPLRNTSRLSHLHGR
mmetsp:Transcript_751/g.1832  ORF Transcript_751/g.1832 Transcript_751/m.1832 type:complete len:211 (-) Transcript_751:671-1303(-)